MFFFPDTLSPFDDDSEAEGVAAAAAAAYDDAGDLKPAPSFCPLPPIPTHTLPPISAPCPPAGGRLRGRQAYA